MAVRRHSKALTKITNSIKNTVLLIKQLLTFHWSSHIDGSLDSICFHSNLMPNPANYPFGSSIRFLFVRSAVLQMALHLSGIEYVIISSILNIRV